MEAADIAWILAAVALVALMFPGLAFLYGGMLGSGQVLNMFMMVMGSLAVTSVVYVIYGHGLVLGDSVGAPGTDAGGGAVRDDQVAALDAAHELLAQALTALDNRR